MILENVARVHAKMRVRFGLTPDGATSRIVGMDSTPFSADAVSSASDASSLLPGMVGEAGACNETDGPALPQIAALKHRLTRIEGQVRGLSGLVGREQPCVDILTQSAAIISALRAFEREILSQHVAGRLAPAIAAGDSGAIDELADCLRRSIR